MNRYLIKIVMPDGSVGEHDSIYSDGFAAIVAALDVFPDARRISALRSPA